jgi:Histidine kinase-, DNA gyrase B-, and HSP90-like ATPase.
MVLIFIFILVIIIIVLLRLLSRMRQEVNDFSEAIMYNDFTRHLSERKLGMRAINKSLNRITKAIASINKEKTAQQHYMQKMLELVDTGILVYEINTNEVLWFNEACANILNAPTLKNINWLKKRDTSLYDQIVNIPMGERKVVVINTNNQAIRMLTNASLFETDEGVYKLIAFHNVGSVMEEAEYDAWKGLLNVMTHEIMNSITPVASLTETLKAQIQQLKAQIGEGASAEFEDIESAMETVHRRSVGLLHFSEVYRNLSRKIVPEIRKENLYSLITSIYNLMNSSLEQKGISLEIKTDTPTTTASIDRNLIEQTVINFITNATHAVRDKEEPNIIIFSGTLTDGSTYITVADNGCGIPAENRDKIFIPFFTTKQNGTGIGLSLSREIAKLHKASVQIQSKEGEGTAITILFDENKSQ